MRGTKFLTERQYLQALALGLSVDSEGGQAPFAVPAGGDGRVVYNKAVEQRRPVLIRIQNISGSPVSWSENLDRCNANQRNGVLPPDSVGGAAANGDGGWIEFQAHMPKSIHVFCAAAVNILVTKRYADEN